MAVKRRCPFSSGLAGRRGLTDLRVHMGCGLGRERWHNSRFLDQGSAEMKKSMREKPHVQDRKMR
jgi:hypothetical protein